MEKFTVCKVTIDGQEVPDFGFRPLVSLLNDYDLFRDYAGCWESDCTTNAHITAYYQRNPQFSPAN
jgi:hypothetical protein